MENGPCDCGAALPKIMDFFKTTIESMEKLEVKISAPTNCVIDNVKKIVEFSEYGEHIMTISIDDLQKINTAYIVGADNG